MISYSEGTMVQHDTGPGTAQSKTMSEIGKFSPAKICVSTMQHRLFQGTMVINNTSDDPMDENLMVTNYDTMVFNEGTMVVNETDDIGAGKKKLP